MPVAKTQVDKISEDTDPITVKSRGDMTHVAYSALGSLNIKLAFFVFFMFIILNTDVFINRILNKIPGSVAGYPGHPTTKGTIIVAVFLVIAMILMDTLVQLDVV